MNESYEDYDDTAEETSYVITEDTRKLLKEYVTKLEALAEQKAGIAEDERHEFQQAKAYGLDSKTLKTVLRRRKQAKEDRLEQDTLVQLYEEVLENGC